MTIITRYTPADREVTEKLIAELQDDLHAMEPEIIAPGEIAASYLQCIVDRNEKTQGMIYLASQDGHVIGMIAVRVDGDPDEVAPHLYISDIVVTESARNQGIGTRLLEQAQDYARKLGLVHLKIGTLPKNLVAYHLYAKFGFQDYAMIMRKKLT